MNVILQPMISTNTITHSSWETTNIYVYKAEHYTTAYDGERIGQYVRQFTKEC